METGVRSEDKINQRLGRAIAKKRKAAGYNQDQVAEHLEIGKEAFSRIERGVVGASVAKLYAMADMFECGVETFLIEGSRRTTDQVENIDRAISGLSVADRQFIVQIVDKLAHKLKGRAKSKAADDGGDDGFLL
jgi:transcriptional regulator with XRE-family HTH domain